MMDASITRRGQPCWYKVEGVDNIAINDAFMLEGAIYYLLKKHFRPEPYYVDLLELFHDVRPFLRPLKRRSRRSCVIETDLEWGCLANRVVQVTFQTELGQLIDLITAPEDNVDLSKFSLDKSVHFLYTRCDIWERRTEGGWGGGACGT